MQARANDLITFCRTHGKRASTTTDWVYWQCRDRSESRWLRSHSPRICSACVSSSYASDTTPHHGLQ